MSIVYTMILLDEGDSDMIKLCGTRKRTSLKYLSKVITIILLVD